MKEVISWKRSLPGLMYMKGKLLRKSKKLLKIEPKKKTGKSTRRKTSKDAASGREDGAKKMDEEAEMSSVETGENEAGKNTATGTESGVKKMDEEVEMSSVETGENEPRKEVASGSEDGTQKMDVDFTMSPMRNAEIEDSKDDGTSIKKNEVYPTSNLGVGGEFHVALGNMESKDTTSYKYGVIKAMEKSSESLVLVVDDQYLTLTDHLTEENKEAGKTGCIDMQEPLSDVLKQGSQGTEVSLGENAGCTAADGINKKKYVGPDFDDGDEYLDNEALVAASVSKEDSEKVTDAKDVCGNAEDVTLRSRTNTTENIV